MFIPLTAFIALQSDYVQTLVAKHTLKYLSDNIKTKFSIGEVNVTFFNQVEINNLYIEDFAGDTLLYSEKVTANISRPKLRKKVLVIQRVTLDDAFINFYIDSTRTLNLKYVLDKFIKKGKEKKDKWDLEFKNIRVNNSRFNLANSDTTEKEYGINFNDLELSNLNIDLRRLKPEADTINFIIKDLNFHEKSGFNLTNFSSRTSICSTHMTFEDYSIVTPLSSVKGGKANLHFNNYSDFRTEKLFASVHLDVSVQESSLNLFDLSYFAPVFRDSYQALILSGDFKGTIDNLAGKNINIKFGKYSSLTGNFDLDGLPDINETFIFAKFSKLQTRVSDLKEFTLPGNRQLNFPEIFDKMGVFHYAGQFTGFINDFVAYGTLTSDLGLIKTDVLLKPDASKNLVFSGKVTTENFKLGELLQNEKNIGNISFQVKTDGSIESGKSISANTSGEIQYLELKKYVYRNIKLSGTFQNKRFNGDIYVKDPNIIFDFMGILDFASDTPRYDFDASVTHANLYALNIDRSDPEQEVSFDVEAHAEGNSLSNMNGNVKLVNALFTKKDGQIQVYDLYASAYNNHISNSFIFRSDFVDVDVSGSYQVDKISESLNKFVHSYLPSLVDSGKCALDNLKNGFQFKVTFKNTKPIFNYFLPDYFIGENTSIEGIFEPDSNHLYVHAQSPVLRVKNNTWNNLYLNAESNDSILNVTSGSENLMLGNKINLENFTIYSDLGSDTLDLMLRWNNWDSATYRGELNAAIQFERHDDNSFPALLINLKPTKVITYDTIWNIAQCDIKIDRRKIEADNIYVNHKDQYFRVYGTVSENPDDNLNVEFHDFNLDNLNMFTGSEGFYVNGILNGNANISNIFANPVFYSQLNIDTLRINNEMLGSTVINSKWNNLQKSILINAYAKRGNLKTIDIEGEYLPGGEGKLDFSINLDKLRLELFNPYIKNLASNLKGLASGNLRFAGSLKKPVTSGELLLQKASFTVNYLKTRYNFTKKVTLDKNNILINDLQVFDNYGNSSLVNGTISNNYLKNFRFNITINANDFEFLNTSHLDNSQFYGSAFGTGLVIIRGTPKNITMDINAKTEKNTRIFIPLSNPETITQYNFVNFVPPDEAENTTEIEKKYKVNLTGLQLNFDLEVTPDAEVQLIFDPTVGDIIKGNGSGNLRLQINTLGQFNMYGNYTVEEGEYLFTLLNVINRKFLIDYGGTINWNGDPFDAEINLKAIYRTKASLKDLLVTPEANKTTIDCQILMTGKLMSPNIQYDIYLPNVEESTRELVKSKISSNEELNKQFASLLVLSRFLPPEDQTGTSTFGNTSPYSDAANVNASEFLSNQISNWLSQISNDVDFQLNYRSGNSQIKSNEVEVAMSTQLLNDRLTIYGNLGVPTNTTNATAQQTNKIVGDVDVDYKITNNGKLRIKAFNHTNEDQLNTQQFYTQTQTQGVGLVYKEEFNTFGELWRRYMKAILGDRKKSKSVTSN